METAVPVKRNLSGLTSMTGFGRAEVSLPSDGRAVVEVRTLNHRFLEVELRMPEGLQSFEAEVRSTVGQAIRRGQVRVGVSVRSKRTEGVVRFDERAARRYAQELRRFKRRLGLSGEVTLEMLLDLPGVVTVPGKEEEGPLHWPQIRGGILQALAQAVKMREREGERLVKASAQILRDFERLKTRVRRRLPAAQKGLQKRLSQRIQAALKRVGGPPSPEALLSETAALVQSNDVSEELARIDSHLTALWHALGGHSLDKKKSGPRPGGAANSGPGRTIDFLAQELHREINTLGTKARDGAVVGWVVAMKGQVEKLREQAANLE